jgi:hypothetical protein
MASTSNERVVYLDDILADGYGDIAHRDGTFPGLTISPNVC